MLETEDFNGRKIIQENEPIEQYVAQEINTGVDNAANSITNFSFVLFTKQFSNLNFSGNGLSDFGQAAHDKFVGAAQAVGQFFSSLTFFTQFFFFRNLRLSLILGNGFENMKDGAEQWFGNAGNHVKNLWNDAGEIASFFSFKNS